MYNRPFSNEEEQIIQWSTSQNILQASDSCIGVQKSMLINPSLYAFYLIYIPLMKSL